MFIIYVCNKCASNMKEFLVKEKRDVGGSNQLYLFITSLK